MQDAGVDGGGPPRPADRAEFDVLRHVDGEELLVGDLADDVREQECPVSLFNLPEETRRRDKKSGNDTEK
jgi:hypothetical protein